MRVIGLTGSIGSGKSTVSGFLKEKGALVIDADVVARDVVEPGKPAWKEIVGHFGEDILEPDRKINRRKLGMVVFADRKELEHLNAIIHPRVIEEIQSQLKSIEREFGDGKIVVVDVPLLFEVGLDKLSDLTVVVAAGKDVRIKRLIGQGLSREEAETRIAAQSGKENLEKLADIVITNNGTVVELREKVEELWKRVVGS